MISLTLIACLKAGWRTDVPFRLAVPAIFPGRGGNAILADGAQPGISAQDTSVFAAALGLRARIAPRPRVIALSVGPRAAEGVLRDALAAGADEVLRVWPQGWNEDADLTLDGCAGTASAHAMLAAEALRPLAARGGLLILTGEASADQGHGAFGAFLAQGLGFTFAHRVSTLSPLPNGWTGGWSAAVKLERGYTQDLVLEPSAVVTVAAQGQARPEAPWPAWLASRTADIPAFQPQVPRPSTTPAGATTLRPPVPRVKRYTVPPATLTAEQRIRALIGTKAQGSGTVLAESEGVERQVETVLALLHDRGYLPRGSRPPP